MNDFLRVEIYSLDEAYLILMRPGEDGSEEINRMKIPFGTLRDMATQHWALETLRDNVMFAERGIFSEAIRGCRSSNCGRLARGV